MTKEFLISSMHIELQKNCENDGHKALPSSWSLFAESWFEQRSAKKLQKNLKDFKRI